MSPGSPRLNNTYWRFLHTIGAHQVPHSGRTLLDHLTGTYELLTQWGSNEATCVAGLFHSVYGTQTFGHSLLDHDQRNHVRSMIGDAAEQLVFLFSTTDRDSFFENIGAADILLLNGVNGEFIDVPPETLSALVEIEVANTLEQIPHKKRISPTVMNIYARQCIAARPVIPGKAYRHCVRVFECNVSDLEMHEHRL